MFLDDFAQMKVTFEEYRRKYTEPGLWLWAFDNRFSYITV